MSQAEQLKVFLSRTPYVRFLGMSAKIILFESVFTPIAPADCQGVGSDCPREPSGGISVGMVSAAHSRARSRYG